MLVALALVLAAGTLWPADPDPAGGEDRVGDRVARVGAAERLARVETGDSSDRLRALLDDLDPAVRATAGRALAQRQDEAALARAARWVLSGNPIDRAVGMDVLRAARALPPAARGAVERALADADATVKLMALEVLADKDPRPSLAAVTGALEDSAAPVRLQAVRLLGEARDPRAALALLGRTGDADRLVRREAITALGALGDERVVPALLRLLEGPVDDLRRAAIESLTGLRSAAAVPALLAHARRRPADSLARHAQWALGELATPEAVAALVALLGEPPVTDELRRALLRTGPRAVPLLVRELEGDPGVATEAAALLGRIGDRRAVSPLLALLRRRNQTQPAVLRALAGLAPREASAALVAMAGDASREIRRLVLDALVAIGDERSVVVLDRALVDPEPAVRARAAALTGKLRARQHTAALAALLADADPAVRARAIAALGAAGGPDACAALARAPASTLAEAALAEALEAAAEPACVPALVAALRATTPDGRRALVHGLASATLRDGAASADVVRALLAALDGAPTTAEPAAEALASVKLSGRQLSELIARFEGLPAPIRARLCPALGASAAGRARLASRLSDSREDDEVRAAAAWALAGAVETAVRRSLEHAQLGLHPAIAANARAALARTRPSTTIALRLRGPTGRPLSRQWLWVGGPGGTSIWARTGAAGAVRLSGFAGEAAVIHAAGGELTLAREDPGDRQRQVSGEEVPGVERPRGLLGGQAVQVHARARGVQR